MCLNILALNKTENEHFVVSLEVLRQLPETYGERSMGATVGACAGPLVETADGFLMRLQIAWNNINESSNSISSLHK